MCPDPRTNIPGKTASIVRATPRTLTSSIWRNPSRSRSSADERLPTPAQATRTSVGPTRSSSAATARSRPSPSRTSATSDATAPPAPRRSAANSSRGPPARSSRPSRNPRDGERRRGRPPDPLRGAGHQDGRCRRSFGLVSPSQMIPIWASWPARRRPEQAVEEFPDQAEEALGVLLGRAVLGTGDDGGPALGQVLGLEVMRPWPGTARTRRRGPAPADPRRRSARRSAPPRPWSRRRRWSCRAGAGG